MRDLTPPLRGASVPASEDAARHAQRGAWATVGAIGAAFLASLCCIGPLVFVAFGVGAGMASAFEPLRPIFTVLTVGLIAVGFYTVYGKKRSPDAAVCGPDGTCAVPRSRSRDKIVLWAATIVALLLLTFPQWSLWFV